MPSKHQVKIDSHVAVWDKIEIILNEDNQDAVYVSRVEHIDNKGIIASRPDFISGKNLLRSNVSVYIRYCRPDAMYRMPAILSQIPGDVDGKVRLTSLGNIERMQRRDFVRIKKRIDLLYALLKNDTSGFLVDSMIWYRSYSRDISAGGLSLNINDDIRTGDILIIRIKDYDTIGIPRFVAAICRRISLVDEYRFGGMQFILKDNLRKLFNPHELEQLPDIVKRFDKRVLNRMIRYIFEEQIRERQKGLI